MKKLFTKSFSLFIATILVINGLISLKPFMAEAAVSLPKVAVVSLDHTPFIEGDSNKFFISSKNYTGKVQYQLFYTCKTTMGNKWELIETSDMTNGWTQAVDGDDVTTVDISGLNLSADFYRFAIRVRRIGYKGKYSNVYGDYDYAYPFVLTVVDKDDIKLNGDMEINKEVFMQGETLQINGVEGEESSTEYKLHLFDVKNSKWLTNLTDYSTNINYSLKNLPEGKYIVDIWGRKENSTSRFDGYKLKTIEIKKEQIPQVAIVSLDHTPFREADRNKFFISSKGFNGQVQYQLFYTCKATMGNNWEMITTEGMIDGWTEAVDAQEPITVDISNLHLIENLYRFAIRVRRVGYQGKYSNKYGDYDNAYPFTINVSKTTSIRLWSDMLINKTEYAKNDQLIIDGVQYAADDTQYKLHLYDVKNNKWLTNLTEYEEKISYDLSNIPEGTYIVDIWCKKNDSTQKYDGWKLKTINITSEIREIASVEDIIVSTSKNSKYRLPQTAMATFEDGSSVKKQVSWNGIADTSNLGVYTFEGTIQGYEGKVKLTLKVEDVRGNTAGNVVNVGLVAGSNDWIYYVNYEDEGMLYKVKTNGEGKTKISDDIPLYLNVVEDWIYYCNLSDDGKLYKIKTDGTGRTRISNDIAEEIIVENEWLYYANAEDDYKLYKIKNDGTSRTKLNNDYAANANLVNGYIYYTNCSDNFRIYRIKADGTGRTALNNDMSGFLNVVDGWIYYENLSDSNKIYKVSTSGTNRGKVSDVGATFLNVTGGWIYYTNLSDDNLLYKMKIDGTSNEVLNNAGSFFIHTIDDYIYYENEADEYNLYRIKNDGTENQRFHTAILSFKDIEVTVEKNSYYSLPNSIYAKRLDGSNYSEYITWDTTEVDTSKVGEYIYEGTGQWYTMKVRLKVKVIEVVSFEYEDKPVVRTKGTSFQLPYSVRATFNDGSNKNIEMTWEPSNVDTSEVGEYVIEGTPTDKKYDRNLSFRFSVVESDNPVKGEIVTEVGEWIYYKNIQDNNYLYRIKKDGTGKTKASEKNSIYILDTKDEWIYFNEYNQSWKLYRMKADGTEKSELINGSLYSIKIVGDLIYFSNPQDNGNFYSMKLDGTNKTKIRDNSVGYNHVSIKDNCIYYSNSSDWGRIYKMNLDGTNATRINTEPFYKYNIYGMDDEWIYYTDRRYNSMYRIGIDGKQKIVLSFTEEDYLYIKKIQDGWIYYNRTVAGRTEIAKKKVDGSETIKLGRGVITGIDGEWIYYRVHDGISEVLYKIKTDGTENQLVY